MDVMDVIKADLLTNCFVSEVIFCNNKSEVTPAIGASRAGYISNNKTASNFESETAKSSAKSKVLLYK